MSVAKTGPDSSKLCCLQDSEPKHHDPRPGLCKVLISGTASISTRSNQQQQQVSTENSQGPKHITVHGILSAPSSEPSTQQQINKVTWRKCLI